ncbi:MAG TPA: fumarate/nitrate reduction transcriptional regulator Fnr [Usitatibacteraceae bacterium]|nr:fumarate/nitrate reduction transcriptional regulator Fnr [Usitatibacteraceae bacterium]
MNKVDFSRQRQVALTLSELKVACQTCNLREICLPAGLNSEEIAQLDQLVNIRRKVRKGDALYRTGEQFDTIYAVRSGFFKTRVTWEDGRDQVTGFSMAGEILGMDGIGQAKFHCDAIALEDSEVCCVPYGRLEEISRELTGLQRHFHKVMSREIVRENGVMMLLGVMRAEERLAAFLLNLSQRLEARGFSPLEFNLRPTREEIGSYLGLKLETVSRTFSRFAQQGLIEIDQKFVRIIDVAGLRKIYAHHTH